jgi:hypothetical protein
MGDWKPSGSPRTRPISDEGVEIIKDFSALAYMIAHAVREDRLRQYEDERPQETGQ